MQKIVIILNALDKDRISKRLIDLYRDTNSEVYTIDFKKDFTKQIKPGTTEILFGGGGSSYLRQNPELKTEAFKFITSSKIPMFGICFGAQLIARAFGARMIQLPMPAKGLFDIRILSDKEAFDDKYMARVYKNQAWSLQNLPDEFNVIGCSGEGIEIFLHRHKPIAGVQFHPEQFGQASDGRVLFKNLRRIVLTR